MSLDVGDKAPDFTLPTDGDGKIKLSDLKGKKVVLYFYPKDDTPGCTKEACAFGDDVAANSRRSDAAVIGISRDSVASHDKFKKKYKLPFTLASDSDGKVTRKIRRVGREEHLWPQIYGHRACDLPDRREGQDRAGLAQGESARSRRRGNESRQRQVSP